MKTTPRRIAAVSVAVMTLASVARAEAEQSATVVSAVEPPETVHRSLQNEVNAAIDRGLDWMAAKQSEDGSWSNGDFPALTALPLWAFARAEHPRKAEVVDAAVNYILSCVHDDGSIFKHVEGRKGGGLSNYNTAVCMTALYATGRPELNRVVQKARTFVAGAQYVGDDEYSGGFGYDAATHRAYTDLVNTYYSAQAMRLTAGVEDTRPTGEPRADIDWNATVTYIGKMQNPESAGPEQAGGFFYNPSDPKAGVVTNAEGVVVFRSYGSITYAGLLALVFADVSREDVRVRSALKWAERQWTLDENPGMGQNGLYFFYHVLTRALDASGYGNITLKDGGSLNWREAVARRLVSLQRLDPDTGHGYWVNENGAYWENNPVLTTSYVLLALEALSD
jgi:squalene-hopene/tetraprenyl-beta-curcumene cyclase